MTDESSCESQINESQLPSDDEITHSNYLKSWCRECDDKDNLPPNVKVLVENEGISDKICEIIKKSTQDHLVGLDKIASWGYEDSLAIIKGSIPTEIKKKSGLLGEIIATDYVEQLTEYRVPLKRLRHQSDREMPMHGDDLIAIKNNGGVTILKGEAKSRKNLTDSVIKEALIALNKHNGQPNPSTLSFMAKNLNGLDSKLFVDIINKKISFSIEHLLFAFSGNDPSNTFDANHNSNLSAAIQRYMVGIHVKNHQEFIKQVFEVSNENDC